MISNTELATLREEATDATTSHDAAALFVATPETVLDLLNTIEELKVQAQTCVLHITNDFLQDYLEDGGYEGPLSQAELEDVARRLYNAHSAVRGTDIPIILDVVLGQ
jgi:hypothetical protein